MKLEYLSQKDGFLGMGEELMGAAENAQVVVIPYGLEKSVSYMGGTAKGPQAMIDASKTLEFFDEDLWCEPFREVGIATLKEPKIPANMLDALKLLEEQTKAVLDQGKFPFIFGGEHSITCGSIRPFAKKYKDLAILHFDAHADLRDGYDNEHYSHAAALRRCLDFENVSLVSCAIRNISQEELPFYEANKHRIKIYWARDKKKWNVDEIVKHLEGKPVYLSFDIDGFDASMIPATGTPEPGGIFWYDAIQIIAAAAKKCNIVGADINELAPIKGMHACDFLAAKLAYKIISLVFLKHKIGKVYDSLR
ncbi:MAG TPA: agmatinase [Alphaproteobacteria bacterium]|nr:agmatinase [Alphaproteobacteria bacterium]